MNKISCPICHKATTWENNQYRPFCSHRCKVIDLGSWADGSYSVPGKKTENSETEDNNSDNSKDN